MFSSYKTIFALASLAVSALSAPVPEMQDKRSTLIVWSPKISSPAAGDTYNVGDDMKVEWNAKPPSGGENKKGRILLAQVEKDGSYTMDSENPLAENFKLTEGQQTVIVPNSFQGDALYTDSNYAIILFGDSGNLSGQFTINGEDDDDDSDDEPSSSASGSSDASA